MAIDCQALLEDAGCFYCLTPEQLSLVYGGMLVLLADFHGSNSDLQTALDDAADWSGKSESQYWAAMDYLWVQIGLVADPTIDPDPCARLFDEPCLGSRTPKELLTIMVQTFCNELISAGVVADCTVAQYLTAGSKFNSLNLRDRALAYLSILCGIATVITGAAPCATFAQLFTNNPWNCHCCGPVIPKVFGAIASVMEPGSVETFFILAENGDSLDAENADNLETELAP